MSNNENILLCDIGGTHARFANYVTYGQYDHFKKYRLENYKTFEEILQQYINETGIEFMSARFAAAKTPIDGIISYKRFEHDPNFEINFPQIKDHFNFTDLLHLDDMEPALKGAIYLDKYNKDLIDTVVKSSTSAWNNHKQLISIGTGLGYAHAYNDRAYCTPGGHVLALTVTEEQRKIEKYIRFNKASETALIMEDFVSLSGLRMIDSYVSGWMDNESTPEEFMQSLKSKPDVPRIFFEFLGLYAHMVTCSTAFYGGIFLTGGVLDHLVRADLARWDAFEQYFRPSMLPVINQRLSSCPVKYVLHEELPLLGLTNLIAS